MWRTGGGGGGGSGGGGKLDVCMDKKYLADGELMKSVCLGV